MINGRVAGHHALLELVVRSRTKLGSAVEFLIDTGFDGYLTLPPAAVQALDLPFLRRITASLADGSTIHISAYLATIRWDDQEREVEALATGIQPLLGTLMLNGHQ